MEIIRGLESITAKRKTVVTIGTFDGIHLGHKKIINCLTTTAKKFNVCSTVVTFDPHPKIILSKNRQNIKLLTSLDEKLDIFKELNVDKVIVLKFDEKISDLSYTLFVKDLLIEKVGMTQMIVGYDHAFGKNRAGTFDALKELSKELNFGIYQVGQYQVESKIISSSIIREYALNGNVEKASSYLGSYYSLSGKVIHGDGRGKEISFPTANIELDDKNKIIPNNGVYAVNVEYKTKQYKGMMNIGDRPTFRNSIHALEVNIFDFDKNIYGEKIKISFKKRLRKEIKFSSSKELVTQLKIDKEKSLLL